MTEAHPPQSLTGRSAKSIALDKAYDSYCRRREAGEQPDPDAFCQKFSAYRSSLRRLIETDRFFQEHPELLLQDEAIDWPQPGQHFLGFDLKRELGRGAFARVFLATEPALGNRVVAVKISVRGSAEAETLGRLVHDNIVPVHSVRQDEETGLTAVCMAYRGSATLNDVFDRIAALERPPRSAAVLTEAIAAARTDDEAETPLRPVRGGYIDAIVRMGVQLATAVAWIHERGICHRDLKPSNVLLNADGAPMLLDFNLSFDERLATSRLGGTLPYMSPEQLLATDESRPPDASLIDARSDLFSLGVILYELLARQHPFGEFELKLSSQEVRGLLLLRHRQGPLPLRRANRLVDPRLARVIEKCLAYNPKDRPESAGQLASELARCLRTLPRLRRWALKHPYATAGASVLLVALAASVYGLCTKIPSYAMREFQRGLAGMATHDYALAEQHFDRALAAEPRFSAAAYGRGRAHLELQLTKQALDDFNLAESLAPDGRTAACMAYCQAKIGVHDQALRSAFSAINRGFATAEVFNNLGFDYLRITQLAKARDNLDRALQLKPSLQPALFNRAQVGLMQLLDNDRTHCACAFADIEKALALGPNSANTFIVAAALYANAPGRERPPSEVQRPFVLPEFGPAAPAPPGSQQAAFMQRSECTKRAIAFAREAVANGYPPRNLEAEPVFRTIKNEPAFQSVIHSAPRDRGPEPLLQVVDPITNAALP